MFSYVFSPIFDFLFLGFILCDFCGILTYVSRLGAYVARLGAIVTLTHISIKSGVLYL